MTKEFLKNVFLLTCLYASAIAQLATTTSLVGTVTDSSGRAVQGAKVTAVETRTAATLNTTTTSRDTIHSNSSRSASTASPWSSQVFKR